MSNPWGVKLKKTGLNEQRSLQEQSDLNNLEDKQSDLQNISSDNTSKKEKYNDRQASLAADAMIGQQGRLLGQGGKKKSRKHRKSSRRHKKHKKTRRHRRRH
jgi:hypothetical protein